ncbi:MAG: hypothetical protein V4541_04820 [Bacteroidota bacterium]
MRSFNPIYSHLENIPKGELSIYLPCLTLTLKNREIKGTGHLSIVENQYQLNVINSNPPNRIEQTWNLFGRGEYSYEIGKLQSVADFCYALDAEDDHGNRYRCDYVYIPFDHDQILYNCTFKSKISIFSEEGIIGKRGYASIIFKNKYDFATNQQKYKQSTFPSLVDDRSQFKRIWEIQNKDMSAILHRDVEYLTMDVYSEQLDFDDSIIKQIIDALNFVMGLEHQYYYQVLFGESNSFHIQLNPSRKSQRKTIFTPPYRKVGSIGDEAEENAKLFNSYFNYIRNEPENIFNKLQKRLADSGTGYYYKHGLIVSTTIESILRVYYPKEDEVFSDLYLADIQTLKDLTLNLQDPVILQRLSSLLSDLVDKTKYIPGKMLKKLENDGIIGKGSLNAWKKLRNRFAHGDDYNDELLKAAGLVQQNVTIFYELIFNIIGYQGKYTKYSLKAGNCIATYPRDTGDQVNTH